MNRFVGTEEKGAIEITSKELRTASDRYKSDGITVGDEVAACLLEMAADEIDRLTAEVERLKQQSVDMLGEQLEAK